MNVSELMFIFLFILSFFYMALGLLAYAQLDTEQKKKAIWALDPTWPFHAYSDGEFAKKLHFHGKWLFIVCTLLFILGLYFRN
jgi:hypothetical protein